MPWHIETDNAACDGFAVVKDGTAEVEGCHRTRGQAERQMAALYASEPQARASYTPTGEMREEARRGLAWREEFGRGGTAVGVARARDISNGRELPLDTVARMVSYFARHEVDKEAEGFRPGEPGFPSAGRIAWALWGGDAGQRWAAEIVDRLEESEDRALEDELEDKSEDDRVVITDIDDTIVRAGVNPIRETIDEINGYGVDVYVLTGRAPSQRPATERLLADIGLRYEELYMVGSQAAKREAINEIAAEHEVIAAYENDPTVRDFYESAGIPVKGGRTRRQQVEEMLAELRANR